jgi:superfamily II DNA or RNA helicase
MLKLQAAEIPTLTLVKEIAHGKALEKLSGVPFVNGQDAESRQYIADFNAGRLKALIGTTGVLGEGIDTRPCQYVIVAGLGKAKSAFMQQVGRSVRKYPGKETAKILIFKDKSHKWLANHFNAQKKILIDEYGSAPAKLEV